MAYGSSATLDPWAFEVLSHGNLWLVDPVSGVFTGFNTGQQIFFTSVDCSGTPYLMSGSGANVYGQALASIPYQGVITYANTPGSPAYVRSGALAVRAVSSYMQSGTSCNRYPNSQSLSTFPMTAVGSVPAAAPAPVRLARRP